MPLLPAQLSPEQIASFERDGALIIPSYFSPDEIAAAGTAIDALVARPPRVGHEMVYFEPSVIDPAQKVLQRIEKFVEEDETLRAMICGSGLAEISAQLLGAPATLFKEKINFKMPGGQGFTPHQDIQPGWDDYAPYFISVLVTIDPSTLANGCLELALGHHKRGWIGERLKPLTPEQLQGIKFEKVPTAPGDLILFDCFAPHQSAPNLTDRPRRNLYLTYNRADQGDYRSRYFADKRASFPPDFERAPGSNYTFKV
jgi:hypothetical protein